jgi:2-C-methyl-D-erythritol 4-phosphate cytidylyltransferase
MYLSAIVLAAGRGRRLGSGIPKPLVAIGSKPAIIYPLQVLNKHPSVQDIIVVVNARNSKGIIGKIREYRIDKVRCVVAGGRRRQDSVYNGLKVIDPRSDLVLIHDGARPFIDRKTLSCLIGEAKENGATICAVPVKATIKTVVRSPSCGMRNLTVKRTLNRDELWEVQTPQVFKKDWLAEAFRKFNRSSVTDDSTLVEMLGKKVGVVLGSYDNIKVTTPQDLLIAEAIAKKWNTR